MIQNQENFDYQRQQEQLTKQITQYKKINASLKKKIHARDKRISYLFSCMGQMSKSSIQTNLDQSLTRKNISQLDSLLNSKKDVCLTEPKNRQKQNYIINHQNIFKDKSLQHDASAQKKNFKLPVLERKNIFTQNPEVLQSKPRIFKIAVDKLIPLKPQQVKKKFQSKFK